MRDERLVTKTILCYMWKKGLSTRAATKEMNDVEMPGTQRTCGKKLVKMFQGR